MSLAYPEANRQRFPVKKHTNAFSGKLVTIVTTSVLTTTVLNPAVHAGATIVVTTGTSTSLARHRIKLPAANPASLEDSYYVVSGITGTPTSNGITVHPGTSTDVIVGAGGVAKGLKGSTRGTTPASIALQSDGDGSWYVVNRGTPATSLAHLVWKTT